MAAYTDADLGRLRDDRRSIGAYLTGIGVGAVSCMSKKQPCVALFVDRGGVYGALPGAEGTSMGGGLLGGGFDGGKRG
jgi:hypothetical protein